MKSWADVWVSPKNNTCQRGDFSTNHDADSNETKMNEDELFSINQKIAKLLVFCVCAKYMA